MHLDVSVLKLMSNESEPAKKKCTFLDYFFFNRSLKLVYLHLRLLGWGQSHIKKFKKKI